jgi:hypothetical protein
MPDILEDDFVPMPPSPERVAARALVLAGVSCRAMIESDAGKQGAEELRQQILPWLKEVGAANKLEPAETELISTPLGELERKREIELSWESEAMATLAWVLHCSELPMPHTQCDAPEVADTLGFLCGLSETPLFSPKVRNGDEIDRLRDTYLTLHWRLRQFSVDSEQIDLLNYVRNCKWADMRVDELEIVEGDLGIAGISLKKVKYERFREVLSITQVRHQALNWLLGFEQLYSQVTTDT